MVRIQQTSVHPDKLLIGSDLSDAHAARQELETWAARNGYHLPRDARQLSVFEHGALVREWVLVESVPRRGRLSLGGLFSRRKARALDHAA